MYYLILLVVLIIMLYMVSTNNKIEHSLVNNKLLQLIIISLIAYFSYIRLNIESIIILSLCILFFIYDKQFSSTYDIKRMWKQFLLSLETGNDNNAESEYEESDDDYIDNGMDVLKTQVESGDTTDELNKLFNDLDKKIV
jgi:hypothetical protein